MKTIGGQIIEAMAAHEPDLQRTEARTRAAELLREVEISQAERRLDDYPHQYSGGMRQRVAIAMAIALNPSVLIADEPTTALDVTTQAQVLALLDRLVDRAPHGGDLDHAQPRHRLGVLRLGRRDVRGPLRRDLRRRAYLPRSPTHPYSEALLKCVPNPERLAEGPLPAIAGFPPDLSSLPSGCSFAPRCPVGRELPECHEHGAAAARVSGPIRRPATVECHFAETRIAEVSRVSDRRIGSREGRAAHLRTTFSKVFAAERRFGPQATRCTVLDDISLTVRRGESFGLVGESGCGKSTLARCLLRLLDLSEGRVQFDGVDLDTLDRDAAARSCAGGCSSSSRTPTPRSTRA